MQAIGSTCIQAFFKALFSIVLCAHTTILFAQKDSLSSTQHLQEVVVKGTFNTSQLTSGAPMQVLSSESLKILGLDSWADAAKFFTAVQLKDYGGVGSLKTINVRNMGAEHTQVSYDGVMLSNMQTGSIDLSRYYIYNVEQATLSLGAITSLLQSAKHYASASVVNFNTRNSWHNVSKTHSQLNIWLKYGSFGEKHLGANYAQQVRENTLFDVSSHILHSKGNYPFTLKNGSLITTEERLHNRYFSANVELNLRQHLSSVAQLHTKVYAFQSQQQLPNSVVFYVSRANETLKSKQTFIQSVYNTQFSTLNIWLRGIVKWSYSQTEYKDVDVKYPLGEQTDVNNEQELYGSLCSVWKPFSSLKVAFAHDMAYHHLRNNLPLQAQPIRLEHYTAFTLQYEKSRFKVESTLLYHQVNDKTNFQPSSLSLHKLLPTLSLSACLSSKPLVYARISYKDAVRMPTFTDLYYLRLGNTHLQPEQAHLWNIGASVQLKPSSKNTFNAHIDAYYGTINNKLVAFPTLYVWKMTNFGRVNTTGFELSASLNTLLTKHICWQTNVGYTFQSLLDKTEKGTPVYGKQLPYTPKHRFTVTTTMQTSWCNIGYTLLATSERYSGVQQANNERLEAFAEHSVFVQKNIYLKKHQLQCSLRLKNITNAQYEWIKYYPMPGFSLQSTIAFTL